MGHNTKFKFIVFFFLPAVFFAQVTDEERDYYNWFDQTIGQDHIGLYNGKQYIDTDKNVLYDNEKHAYFKSNEFLKGNLTYDNQAYYNSYMQYNLETDDLVISLKSERAVSVFKLIRDKVDKFDIDGHTFIKIIGFSENSEVINGFQEVLLENASFTLLKRHKKNRQKKIKQLGRRRHLYYLFLSSNNYGILMGREYKKINSKSDIIKLFPNLKKEINSYYHENWRLRKSQPDRFIKMLFSKVIVSSLSQKES
ncbi:hypothetical protein [uncultured Aquimarina sp.]|uniref:hypothetical protein n=1 Tax=uncultured Aquimarina sp. TaxID=575652 RepID=UPI00261E0FE0|nr:hypothetical protein [uncultured Aquimarina sp.]